MEEQSEYFDATENPTLKDKRHELDDEDSGVDNASQILRESSVRCFVILIILWLQWSQNARKKVDKIEKKVIDKNDDVVLSQLNLL